MSTPRGATFTAGLVQMRSGLTPAANLDAAVALIGDAKRAGAAYVQTPEMTNVMDIRRERLLGTVVTEEQDTSLARLRELARQLGIYLHIGSLAIKVSPDRAANRDGRGPPADRRHAGTVQHQVREQREGSQEQHRAIAPGGVTWPAMANGTAIIL